MVLMLALMWLNTAALISLPLVAMPTAQAGQGGHQPPKKKPKLEQQNGQENEKDKKAKEKEDDSTERKDMQNLYNQLKAAKKRIEDGKALAGDQQRVDAMVFWSSLEKYDARKKEIVSKWKQDKNFTWWQTYVKTDSVENKKEKGKMEGHGTRPFFPAEKKLQTNKSHNTR